MSVNEIWLIKDFLNFRFMFQGSNIVHYINLIRYPGDIPTDTINLEIRHNSNDDPGGTYYNAFVTFDLTTLRNNVTDSVILCIKAKEYDSRLYEKCFTYKF